MERPKLHLIVERWLLIEHFTDLVAEIMRTLKDYVIDDLTASQPRDVDSIMPYLREQWDGFTTAGEVRPKLESLLKSDPDFVFEDDAWYLSRPCLSRREERYGSFVLESERMDLYRFARQRLSLLGLCKNPAVHPDVRADMEGLMNWIDTLVDQIAGKNDNSPALTTSVPDDECQQIVDKAKTPSKAKSLVRGAASAIATVRGCIVPAELEQISSNLGVDLDELTKAVRMRIPKEEPAESPSPSNPTGIERSLGSPISD